MFGSAWEWAGWGGEGLEGEVEGGGWKKGGGGGGGVGGGTWRGRPEGTETETSRTGVGQGALDGGLRGGVEKKKGEGSGRAQM